MDPKKLLKILAVVLASFVLFAAILPAFAIEISEDPFVLIPEAEDGSSAKDFTKQLGEVKDSDFWMEYNSDALVLDTEKNAVGAQLKSGIISWNFILGLLQQTVRFITNISLIVGAACIIYAGYLYTMASISGDEGNTSKANSAIKYAAIGIVLVIFSYAILNILVQAFL